LPHLGTDRFRDGSLNLFPIGFCTFNSFQTPAEEPDHEFPLYLTTGRILKTAEQADVVLPSAQWASWKGQTPEGGTLMRIAKVRQRHASSNGFGIATTMSSFESEGEINQPPPSSPLSSNGVAQ
jgi:hypothetical protein